MPSPPLAFCDGLRAVGCLIQAIATQSPYHAIISDLLLPGLPGDDFAYRLRGPLLIAYSGLDRFAPWFDATQRKPELARLLYLLRAPPFVRQPDGCPRTGGGSRQMPEYDDLIAKYILATALADQGLAQPEKEIPLLSSQSADFYFEPGPGPGTPRRCSAGSPS
jgi:hypothetical protein